MSSAETELQPQPSGMMVMHHELVSVLEGLNSLIPRQEPILSADGVPQVGDDGTVQVQTINPLMDLLRKKGVKSLVPRLVRAVTGDIIPAITRTIMAVGAGMADLEARMESMEAHPFLQIAAVEDFNDPAKLDAFLATVAEIVSEQVNFIDPDDERMERNEWTLKMCERMRLGLSIELEDEEDEEEGDEDDDDTELAQGSGHTDDGDSAAGGNGANANATASATPAPEKVEGQVQEQVQASEGTQTTGA